jgi:hypothetical protein
VQVLFMLFGSLLLFRTLGFPKYVHAGPWRPFAIREDNLITRQQNVSGAAPADMLVQTLVR